MKRLLACLILLAGVARAADTNAYRGIILAPGSTLPIVYSVTQTGQVNKVTVNAADYRGDLILTGAVGLVTASGDTITIAEQNYAAGDVLPAVDGSAVTNLSAANLTAGTVATAIDGNAITNLSLSAYPIQDLSNVNAAASPTAEQILAYIGTGWTNVWGNEVAPTIVSTNVTGVFTVDYTAAAVGIYYQTGAITSQAFTVTSTNAVAAQIAILVTDGSAITWNSTIVWSEGSAPTLDTGYESLAFQSYRDAHQAAYLDDTP